MFMILVEVPMAKEVKGFYTTRVKVSCELMAAALRAWPHG
jgi:hypothetical protein